MTRPAIALALFAVLTAQISNASLPPHQPRHGRTRPLIAVLGDNAATETTDYVVPYGILADSGVADVMALSAEAGPIQMRPALRFGVHATITEFDARFPGGADYVIVPNIYEGSTKPAILDWVRTQSRRGATIVGICDGVFVLANAGLLDGRQATGHWRSIDTLAKKHPATHWLRNRRYVADGNVITTSGVTASIPVSIALIEAIGGRDRAAAVAARLLVNDWSDAHDSSQLRIGGKLFTALLNQMRTSDEFGIGVSAGVDEVSLALVADAYSRTMRSAAFTIAPATTPITTKHGLTLLPDRQPGNTSVQMLPALDRLPATVALDRTLDAIEARYGESTASLVALQIEYLRPRGLQATPQAVRQRP